MYVSGAGPLSDLTGWGGAKSGVKNVGHVDGVDSYCSAVDAVPESRVGKRIIKLLKKLAR